jgi:hypothetical protein
MSEILEFTITPDIAVVQNRILGRCVFISSNSFHDAIEAMTATMKVSNETGSSMSRITKDGRHPTDTERPIQSIRASSSTSSTSPANGGK